MLIFSQIVTSLAQSLLALARTERLMPVLVRHSDHRRCERLDTARSHETDMSLKLFAVTILTAVIIMAGNAFSQSTVPPEDIDDSFDDQVIILDPHNLRAAKDYQDFIDRLQTLLIDYQDYFAEYSHVYSQEIRAEIQTLLIQINKGEYCADVEFLSDDLEYLIDKLDIDREDLGSSREETKLYKIATALRRNLELYAEELDDDISERLKTEEIKRKELEKYLTQEREALRNAGEAIENIKAQRENLLAEVEKALEKLEAKQGNLDEEQLNVQERLREILEELKELRFEDLPDRDVIVLPPDLPNIRIEIPDIPSIPEIRSKGTDLIYINPSGKPTVARQITDSIAVPNTRLPIYIKSETGDVRVEGWSRNWMTVQFDVEVLAESEKGAKDFIDQIELKLVSNENGVYVRSHFPSLSDPKRKIGSSSILVYAPDNNVVVCENSFGKISMRDFRKGVRVSSNYCEVDLEDIEGGVEAANKMGSIVVVGAGGTMQIKNNLGPIELSDCSGDIDVENSYAPVRVFGCNGPLVVRNSGQVEVGDHNGRVDIENSNGSIEVSDLNGDLKANNAFRPLIVSDIIGSVIVTNTSASIEAEDIRGLIRASNKYGPISAQYVSGPIEFTNESGRVTLVLNTALTGPSFVNADFCHVDLSLSDESNVFLTAQTDGGVIKADRDYGVVTDNTTSMAKIAFGKGNQELKVSGSNATIVINEE